MLDVVPTGTAEVTNNLIMESVPCPLKYLSDDEEFVPIYDVALNIFYKYFNEELNSIIYNSEKYGWNTLKSSSLNAFIQELRTHLKSTNSYEHDDLILLHYICRAFCDYNERYLNLKTKTLFIEKILYPNLVYIMIKYLYTAHKFINKLINNVFYNYKQKYSSITNKFLNSYFFDEDLIKSTIFYKLLGDQIKNINPETINNIVPFYKSVIFNRFSYFFKTELKVNPIYSSSLDNDEYISVSGLNNIQLNRFQLYKRILYNIKIENMAKSSPIQSQLSYNFDIFKRIIIPNEFQDVLYNSLINSNKLNIDDNKFKIMNIYDFNNGNNVINIIKEIKEEVPIIYKLLKCVHIINGNPRQYPHNDNIINKENVKNNIYDELFIIFKGMYCDSYIRSILENIAENFTNNILSGEYINLLTLNSFKINSISFIYQLRKFVRMCIMIYSIDRK